MTIEPGRVSFTETVVNRIATGWRARKADRRSFLAATAVVGSALATHPWKYATEPMSAYESVCGQGAACNEGWSVFCCTINNGANQCPPGSFVGGWWKADQSGFCCGSARYYVDCNVTCGSDWKCHCGSGSCDQRRVACNQFRYGQCHQEISCYGPVVCRVVTCTPPWQFDRSCTATSLTDNRTVTHSAPCLPGNCPSELTKYYYDRGGPGGRYGPVTAPERASRAGGVVMTTRNALIFKLSAGPVHEATGVVLAKYRALSGSNGPLGEIIAPVSTLNGLVIATFQRGVIISTSAGTRAVLGAIYSHWNAKGGLAATGLPVEDQVNAVGGLRQLFQRGVIYVPPGSAGFLVNSHYFSLYSSLSLASGPLGAPASDEGSQADRRLYTRFQHGRMYWTPAHGASALYEPLYTAWVKTGSQNGPLGYPVGAQLRYPNGSHALAFEKGNLYYTLAHGAHLIVTPFLDKWKATGADVHNGLGLPITNRLNTGSRSRVTCERGAMIYSAGTGVHVVYGPIYPAYTSRGSEAGALGLPVSDIYAVGGRSRCDFQRGSLIYDPATRVVTQT